MLKPAPLLTVSDLHVTFASGKGRSYHALRGIGFEVNKGETLALVGESGSGKSTAALSIMQLLPKNTARFGENSAINFADENLVGKGESVMRTIRGARIGMIFQEPMTALNPLHKIGDQIAESITLHTPLRGQVLKNRVLELLDLVGLSRLKTRLNAFPHELSGGQRQRVMIAMALANNPDILIADEPTTALDVTVQAQILELMQSIQKKLGMSILLITHDLTIVQHMADRVAVMKDGEIVETNNTADIFARPAHPYTQKLINTTPTGAPEPIKAGAQTVLAVNDLRVHFPIRRGLLSRVHDYVRAVDDITAHVQEGETLGIVGESGSGKSTLGYAILRLLTSQGRITLKGQDISHLKGRALRDLRNRMQIVFQDPFGSLSPRMSVADIIGEGLRIHQPHLTAAQRDETVIAAMQDVNLNPDTRHQYPHEFSGGQRQRIAIARAIVLEPEFLVLDEPTSALDMSVQAGVIDLLRDLQKRKNLSYIFISHDLRVVRAISHRVLVMKDGKVVEENDTATLFTAPKTDYTKALMSAAFEIKAA